MSTKAPNNLSSGTVSLRVAAGLLCTALPVLQLINFQREMLREGAVILFFGLLSGYYYTSAWEARRREKAGELVG